jgi:hypothetical protein
MDATWFGLILDQAMVRGFMMELVLYENKKFVRNK